MAELILYLQLYFRVAFLALLLPLASGDCIDLDLGMENGTILDSKITASSVQSASTPAKNGRLNYTSGSSWCAGTSDCNPYLQIDLQTFHVICAVSTQGNSQTDQWVRTYTLKLSKDGSSWTDYKEDGLVKTLEGNNDRTSEVKHAVYGVLTRFLRFVPKTHLGGVCMRTEVFGVKTKPENLALGKSTAQSSTYNYSSTITGASGNAVDGNPDTDFQNGHCSHTKAINPSWWRVDLGANLVPVSEIFIVNRFSSSSSLWQRNEDYKITFGSSSDVAKNDQCEGLYSFIDFKASAVCFINPLITGRYVGIMTTWNQILQLCEVEVYSRENLAFGRPTFQYSGTYKDGRSSKAVDGNSNTHFQYGGPVGSCVQTDKTKNPWWRVDLQQVYHVSEVYIVNRGSECGCPGRFRNFEIRVGTASSGTSLANPTCGGTYKYSLPVGEGTSFFCHASLKGRYVIITILQPNTPLTLCEVEVYSERRACPMQAIGVTSSDAFPGNYFSATSSRGSNVASKGRLHGDGAWSPSTDVNANDYLQIDLQYEFVICAVATQGKPTADEWTIKYKLQFSLIDNNDDWFTYQENNIEKEFNGNSGRNGIVKHSLKEHASARFIRFQPTTFKTHKALRVEVYGILISAVPSQSPCNFTVAAITSTSIKASWQLPPKYARHGIITGFKLFYAKKASQGSPTMLTNNVTSLSRVFSLLDNYTEYEFQVLAFSSKGDGPKSSVVVERTKEDVPSGPPANFSVTAITSTSVTASWELPPPDDRNGIISGFKLFYKKRGSSGPQTVSCVNSVSTRNKVVTGLDAYTEYEFQVLAYTSVGDGPKSSKKYERTKEDAPSIPTSLTASVLDPDESHGPRIKLTWTIPAEPNGVIKSYTIFYSYMYSGNSQKEISGIDAFNYSVDVLGGVKYQFYVGAVTIKPGPNASSSVNVPEYRPRIAPPNVLFAGINKTTFNISWAPLAREKSYGNVILYDIKEEFLSRGKQQKRSPSDRTFNATATYVVLYDLLLCSQYHVSVRAYTKAGPGPYSQPMVLETSKPEAPSDFKATNFGSTEVTLDWTNPKVTTKEGLSYTVKFSGTKSYNKEFKDEGIKAVGKSTTCTVVGLVPGSNYNFEIYGTSVCGESLSINLKVDTNITAPIAPVVLNLTDVTVSVTVVGIYLWPVEQRNGPISAYQVIVLKVVDGAKELPDDYDSKLKGANNTNKGILNFYIAAEIPNVPVYKESWKFNVGDGNIYGGLVNKGLEAGEEYVIFQRAVTRDNNTILGGEASRVAKISIIPEVDITRNTSAVVNVTEGESLTVNCSIGTDNPFWSRQDGGDVDTKTRKREGVLLRIENASIADTGVYVCKHGNDQHTIWIQVLVQVEVEMELVVENYVFTEELKNKSSPAYKETEKNFTTEMDKVHRGVTPGYVRTDVLGFKKGSVQVDFKIVIVLVTNDPENETDLPDVKAETAQRVVVKAKTGFVERLQVKKVIVKTVPLEPANVEFFGIESDELSVRWNPSENADSFQVQRYEVHYRKFEEKLFTNVSQPASDGKTQYTIRIQPLEPETTYMIRVGAANDYGRNFNDESAHKTDPAPFAWWIIVVVVLIILLVLVILVVLIVYKRKRDREREALQQGPRIDALELESAKHEIAVAESKNVKGLSYSYQNDAYKPSEVSWEEIPYENLKLLDELGSGAFGVVYKAEYLQDNGNVLPCAVKSLKPSASTQEVRDLYNELEIMDNVGFHPNLVNLIGACTKDGHLLVVLEIAENGSLIEFLKKNRQTDQSNEIISGLTEQMKTRIATDVARGMAHLAKCRCIHRDLAARNVLLGKDYVAKVSDYGMARDVYEDLMYKKETQGKLPVKWMAIESLQTYIFTIESDVWSYGVLLWEIESGGLKPYAGLNTTELIEALKKGYRLEKPAGCSEDMYQVMRSCWNPNPSARPTFDQLVIQLESEIVT